MSPREELEARARALGIEPEIDDTDDDLRFLIQAREENKIGAQVS
jgi:hypothetical protein